MGLLTDVAPRAVTSRSLPFERLQDSDVKAADSIEAIHLRAEAMTPLLKEILDFHPSPDWGLND